MVANSVKHGSIRFVALVCVTASMSLGEISLTPAHVGAQSMGQSGGQSGGKSVAADVSSRSATKSEVLTRRVTVHVENAPLSVILQQIAQQAGLIPFYTDAIVNTTAMHSLHVANVTVVDAFEQALRGTGFQANVTAQTVAFGRRGAGDGMVQGGVSGTVRDATTHMPLRGATVSLAGTGRTATTAENGTFRLSNVPSGSYTVSVRMLGYVKTTRPITIEDGQTASIDVTMTPSVSALDQVVVTGTIVATAQREVPNAMTVITAKELEQRGITKIDQLFRGDVPGLFVLNRGSENALDAVTMYSRGATSLTAYGGTSPSYTNPIKTYVDGIEIADPSYVNQIDPTSIERIEILTGPQASTIYGSNAINGVIQIFTKRGSTGAAGKPQVTASLLSGWVENNYRSSLTPQHDYSAQVGGTEGHVTYNAGGSWNYIGPWAPAKQTARFGGFGGVRMRRSVLTTDASLRLARTRNRQDGFPSANGNNDSEFGLATVSASMGRPGAGTLQTLDGQTLALTVSVNPVSWWSHEVVLGSDRSVTETRKTTPQYGPGGGDTLLSLSQGGASKRSFRTASTLQFSLARLARAVVTVGADAWQSLSTSLSLSSIPVLTGTLSGTPTVTRTPQHNAGGFLQAQVGLWDALFLTYGLRAEWNPNYGDEAQPNLAPRYGVAYTREMDTPLGTLTAKLRASYGRSTRPPDIGMKASQTVSQSNAQLAGYLMPYYGDFVYQLGNPDLEPEFQQGGEGGLELYLGHRGSIVITRYNQTVENLIQVPYGVDSARSLIPIPSGTAGVISLYQRQDEEGYGYYGQREYLNVGSIRNQGWELQGTLNVGPFTTRGTYSWTKSRVIGVDARVRKFLVGAQYQPGASFGWLPEHTWAMGVTYARTNTTVGLNFTGTGKLTPVLTDEAIQLTSANMRLMQNKARMLQLSNIPAAGYTMVDLNATRRFSTYIEGVLQVQNLADIYRNDVSAVYSTIGRQSKMGLRVRW